MKYLKILLLVCLVMMPLQSGAAENVYNYPIAGSYEATILGTPVSFMPDYIQRVSKFTLVYWSVEGFADVLWAGRSLLEVLPKVGILAGIAAAVRVVAVWCFNRGTLFD